jgi:hypothetical protein
MKEVGLEFGDEIEEVLGAKEMKYNGKLRQLMLYVKWKGKDVASFVPNYEANKSAPELVIQFYESRLRVSLLSPSSPFTFILTVSHTHIA